MWHGDPQHTSSQHFTKSNPSRMDKRFDLYLFIEDKKFENP